MKRILAAVLAAGVALSAASAANAQRDHRDHRGHDRHGPRYGGGRGVAIAPGLVIGQFYNGRGYWDGNRYWHNRYRDRGGWRYR